MRDCTRPNHATETYVIRSSRSLPIAGAVALLATATPLMGQMPGLPVLQNAFSNPGITVGVNYGRTPETNALAGAVAWAPGSGRFAVSGGLGTVRPEEGKSASAYGARISAPVLQLMNDAVGVGAFAGFGQMQSADVSVAAAGVSVGYRRAVGRLGVSVHAAPSYQRHSITVVDEKSSKGLFRFSAGLDVSFGDRIGATVGFESGASAGDDDPGPDGSVFGLGISYALRRVR